MSLDSHLVTEWHAARNRGIDLASVNRLSPLRVWWLCIRGHEYQASVRTRSQGGQCKVCRRLRNGSLADVDPVLAAQLADDLNHGTTAEVIAPTTKAKFHWRCPHGHTWEASVADRRRSRLRGDGPGTGCPRCRLELTGSLAQRFPALSAEWHPTRNGALTPADIGPRTRRLIWWMCSTGHEWRAGIGHRLRRGSGCPICYELRNGSLADHSPELAGDWHPFLNGELTPDRVPLTSRRRVWWRCAHGHEWQTKVAVRGSSGSGCPRCAAMERSRRLAGQKRPSRGPLLKEYPHLEAQWHPTRNPGLDPWQITSGSARRLWWVCELGHEWECAANTRAKNTGCPVCDNIRNGSLAELHPDLALQWHPIRNASLTPSMIGAHSKRKAWWICADGHEWRTTVSQRSDAGNGCPVCALSRRTRRTD